ncbi:hypothetical protein LIA77_00872 [Sarocladium implicatum]|nr:hypothetical protein LIA77_00872 [Sarocladium implicatum]
MDVLNPKYSLHVWSAPVRVRVGEEFSILMGTESQIDPSDLAWCRYEFFTMHGDHGVDVPLLGPGSVPYTDGSFNFTRLVFNGPNGGNPPWPTTAAHPMPEWRVTFYLEVSLRIVATATVAIEIYN